MDKKQYGWYVALAALLIFLLAVVVYGGQADHSGKKEFAFKGTVEKVDPAAKSITVKNENVPGWMNSMSMSYTVDKPEALKNVKPGDQVTAKVYEGDFKVLYDLKVAPPKKEGK
jgi:Cu/Ag efflux protein CusF